MSWLSKQIKSVGKVAKKAGKAIGKGWEAIDDYALPAVGFALGGPAGAAAAAVATSPAPDGGSSGGMVSGLLWITGSGNAAMATLLTETAAAAAVMAPAPVNRLRRESMGESFMFNVLRRQLRPQGWPWLHPAQQRGWACR